MKKNSGWLFDLYEHPTKGVVLWLVGEDGKPCSFHQNFETVFYARGSDERLRDLGKFIRQKHSKEMVKLERVTTREDLFDGPQVVMGIRVSHGAIFRKLSREVTEKFPDLIFYDADIPLTVRYAAAHNVFMMAHCEVEAEPDGTLVNIRSLDSPTELDPKLPKFRILGLRPDTDPAHTSPRYLIAKFGTSYLRLPFDRPRELLSVLNGVLTSFDPDIIQTHFGDGWLFPCLFELSNKTGIPFHPNRDLSIPVLRLKAVNFTTYGRAHYRAPQVHLRGRWHIDVENGMTYNKYHVVGAIEQVRLSSLSLQEVARRSPGAPMSAMQILTALKRCTLIPYQRQKAEIAKNFNEYFKAARGGLTLQPPLGIFENVAVLDFSSKMASIMIKYNVSPETVVQIDDPRSGFEIPELGVKVLSRPGLVPQTLQRMRDKRLALKTLLKSIDKDDPRYRDTQHRYQVLAGAQKMEAVVDALKWLTVVCYGRLRFANSVFGRINSHEVVSYLSRKAITRAKRIAEDMGFEQLHLIVDCLVLSRPGATPEDFQSLADEIEKQTGLPMELENVYSWFAFLRSRQNLNVSVANCFFGRAASNDKHKLRGIALRRGDTCRFVAKIQRGVFDILSQEANPAKLIDFLPDVLAFVQDQLTALKKREVPPVELVVSQTLSREPSGYSVLSPAAAAARQLQAQGATMMKGQRIRFIYIGPAPGVHAWGLSTLPGPREIDVPKYRELALRAVHQLVEPLGVTEKALREWVFGKVGYLAPPGMLGSYDSTRLALPLFSAVDDLRVDNF